MGAALVRVTADLQKRLEDQRTTISGKRAIAETELAAHKQVANNLVERGVPACKGPG